MEKNYSCEIYSILCKLRLYYTLYKHCSVTSSSATDDEHHEVIFAYWTLAIERRRSINTHALAKKANNAYAEFHFSIQKRLSPATTRDGATVLKVGGGDNFASGGSKNFFLTPTFWPVGGQNIA